MGGGAGKIVYFGVGAEFRAALRERPRLGGADQRGTDAFAPRIRLDKPSFDKRDMVGHTALGIGPNRKFDEAESVARIVKGDQDIYWFAQFAGKIAVNLSGVSSRR